MQIPAQPQRPLASGVRSMMDAVKAIPFLRGLQQGVLTFSPFYFSTSFHNFFVPANLPREDSGGKGPDLNSHH